MGDVMASVAGSQAGLNKFVMQYHCAQLEGIDYQKSVAYFDNYVAGHLLRGDISL